MSKMRKFYEKILPPNLLASGGWGLCTQPPSSEFLGLGQKTPPEKIASLSLDFFCGRP